MANALRVSSSDGRPADPVIRAPWRFLVSPPAPGDYNMAVDEALMRSVREEREPVLRLYGWSSAWLSLGRNQPARGQYDAEMLASAGIGVVRRPTGGRSVLHDRELTYSVIAPDRSFGSARRAYRAINALLLKAIRALGSEASIHAAQPGSSPPLSLQPCFAEPADGEIVVGERKMIGSAQLHVDGVLLQHGSIPFGPSAALQALPGWLGAMLDGQPAYLPLHLDDAAARDRLGAAIANQWQSDVAPLTPGELTSAEEGAVSHLRERYGADEWTWRR